MTKNYLKYIKSKLKNIISKLKENYLKYMNLKNIKNRLKDFKEKLKNNYPIYIKDIRNKLEDLKNNLKSSYLKYINLNDIKSKLKNIKNNLINNYLKYLNLKDIKNKLKDIKSKTDLNEIFNFIKSINKNSYYIFIISYLNDLNKLKIVKHFLNIIGLTLLYSFNYSVFVNIITKFSPEISTFAFKLFPIGKMLPKLPIISNLGKNMWFFTNITRLVMFSFKRSSYISNIFSTPIKYNYYYLVLLDMLSYLIILWCEFFCSGLDKNFLKVLVIIISFIYMISYLQAILFFYPKFPIISEASKRFCKRSNLKKK